MGTVGEVQAVYKPKDEDVCLVSTANMEFRDGVYDFLTTHFAGLKFKKLAHHNSGLEFSVYLEVDSPQASKSSKLVEDYTVAFVSGYKTGLKTNAEVLGNLQLSDLHAQIEEIEKIRESFTVR